MSGTGRVESIDGRSNVTPGDGFCSRDNTFPYINHVFRKLLHDSHDHWKSLKIIDKLRELFPSCNTHNTLNLSEWTKIIPLLTSKV